MTKLQREKFKTLLNLSANIKNIYDNIRIAEEVKDKEKKKQELQNLTIALECEENIYESLTILELQEIVERLSPITTGTNIIKNTCNLNPLDMPVLRVCMYARNLLFEKEEIEVDEFFFSPEEKEECKKELQDYKNTTMILELKFALIYLNILKRGKYSSREEYYNIIYLNRLLERNLIERALAPIRLDDINNYLKMLYSWNLDFGAEEDYERETQEELLKSLKDILSNKSFTYSEYIYLLASYFMLTEEEIGELVEEINKFQEDPRMTKEKYNVIAKYFRDANIINRKSRKKDR